MGKRQSIEETGDELEVEHLDVKALNYVTLDWLRI